MAVRSTGLPLLPMVRLPPVTGGPCPFVGLVEETSAVSLRRATSLDSSGPACILIRRKDLAVANTNHQITLWMCRSGTRSARWAKEASGHGDGPVARRQDDRIGWLGWSYRDLGRRGSPATGTVARSRADGLWTCLLARRPKIRLRGQRRDTPRLVPGVRSSDGTLKETTRMFVTARRTPPLEETRESRCWRGSQGDAPVSQALALGLRSGQPQPPDAHHDEPLATRHPKFSSKVFRRRAYHSCRRRNIRGIDMIQRTSDQVLRMDGAKNR